MNLNIYYPFKPYIITQHWGNPSSAYSTQFNDPDFQLHNGVDAFTGRLDWEGNPISEFPVYCPVEGFKIESVTYEPQGGGNQVSLISKEMLMVDGVHCYLRIFLCHAKKILVKVGYEPTVGDLLMIADNTGFSTGIHTHLGLYRLDAHLNKIDSNKATGSYNPEPFFTGIYAVDVATLATLTSSGLRYYSYKLGLS